jgi:hypothetical protein
MHYLLIFLTIIIAAFIIILLLPAILELRKPKDAGPRKYLKHPKTNRAIETTGNYFSQKIVAPPEGLEPSTHELTARCSTELSYGGSVNNIVVTLFYEFVALFKFNRPEPHATSNQHSIIRKKSRE